MIERALLIFWACWLLLVLLAAFRVFAFSFARRRQDKRWGDGSKDQKPAVVIVAVKGFDLQSSPRFFDTLFAQDYSKYRVIVSFESWSDPVAVWLKDELEVSASDPVWTHPESDKSLKNITLVCAGTSDAEGQKVHNQRAAFKHLVAADEVVAFIDADIVFKSDWLARLTAPINQNTHPLATTYRWLIPKRPTLPNQVASVINGSITTQGGWESTTVLWGGSMAITRSVFDKLDVATLLKGSLNDDLRLSKAARAAGHRIAFIRSLIVPTMIDFNWRSFFEFAKRQYTQVKFFSPILYTGTNVVLGFYALGVLSIIAALIYGYFFAWVPVAAAYVVDQFRSLARQQVYLSLFPENGIQRKLFSASWLEHMLTPLWMLLHWVLLLSTWKQSRITWAGITYRIIAKDKTRILNRPVVAGRLPVGVPGLALIAALNDRKRGSYTQPIRPISTGPITPMASPLEPTIAVETAEEEVLETTAITEAPVEETVAVEEPPAPATVSAPAAMENSPPAPSPIRHPGVSAFVTPLTALALPPMRRRRSAEPDTGTFLCSSPAAERRRPSPRREEPSIHLMPVKFYPTNPALAQSSAPSGSSVPELPEVPDEAPRTEPQPEEIREKPSEPVSPGGSFAAHRNTSPRSLRVGVVGRRTAKSSRVNEVGYAFPVGRVARPVSRGAAGRPC
ncbi:MAG: glycosyltransferase [Verrucomicrobiales bacterium]|nr:glycosyltransferase [Verrucomicrobiales bacterium]